MYMARSLCRCALLWAALPLATCKLLLAKDMARGQPPRGWNSYDSFQATTENETLAQGAFMAQHLRTHGFDTLVIDAGWYDAPHDMHSHSGPVEGDLATVDAFGRWIPHPVSYPSSAKTSSFRPLVNKLRALGGIKLGLWIMRGIPWRAVHERLPVKGSSYTADEIALPSPSCSWGPRGKPQLNFALNTSHPGAAAYYTSIAELYAEWGLSFIKMDCTFAECMSLPDVQLLAAALDAQPQEFVLYVPIEFSVGH